MQNWLGAAQVATPLQEHALLRDPHDIISVLPPGDAVGAVTLITEALNALHKATSPTLEERYDDIYLLDGATVERTYVLLREYLDATRQTKQRETELWNGAYNCWDALAAAYVSCVQQYSAEKNNASGFRKLANVATARAIRALRRQLQWLRLRYAQPVPAIWIGLANLYSFIETENIDDELLIYPGETTTIKREFLKAVVQSALSCESLQPPGQDLAIYIVRRYSSQFVLSKTPVEGCTHWFDLKHPQAPTLIAATPAPDSGVLYFGVGGAAQAVQQALLDIEENNRVPADLGFKYPIELSFLTPVLTQIVRDWSGKTAERVHERRATNARLSVLPGFTAIVGALELAEEDPFDFTPRDDAESWVANDVSAGGFGAVLPKLAADWVTVGGVLGVEMESGAGWLVGLVRRLNRLDSGEQQLGIQILSREASAVRMMREESSASDLRITQRIPLDHALLLTANPAGQQEIELLIEDIAPYEGGQMHVLCGGRVLRIEIKEVREKLAACSRAVFTVLGLEED